MEVSLGERVLVVVLNLIILGCCSGLLYFMLTSPNDSSASESHLEQRVELQE